MSCTCCTGTAVLSPMPTANRPGLPSLTYRVGTHGRFFEGLKARLSAAELAPLQGLRTRDSGDFTIALLDGWATMADVLTFYQERLANEGYLRTATERRSILELGRLVGYEPRPGVAASVFFAYTLEKGASPVTIPMGARAQSIPDPGELAQSFETSFPLEAREAWNTLQPRLTRPQDIRMVGTALNVDTLYLAGTSSQLKPGDPLLFEFAFATLVRHVKALLPDATAQLTKVVLQEAKAAAMSMSSAAATSTGGKGENEGGSALDALAFLLNHTPMAKAPTPQFGSPQALPRTLAAAFDAKSDMAPQLLARFNLHAAPLIYAVWAVSLGSLNPGALKAVHALRVKGALYGYNAVPPLPVITLAAGASSAVSGSDWAADGEEKANRLFLDAPQEGVAPGGFVVVEQGGATSVLQVDAAAPRARFAYGIGAKTLQIEVAGGWPVPSMAVIRSAQIFAGSEALPLAEAPLPGPVHGQEIELGHLYPELHAGRWVIVAGERADLLDATGHPLAGVQGAELAMLSGVTQDFDPSLPGDQVHTRITFAKPLAYAYNLDTALLYANVVKATHGETRQEVLGSGEGSQSLQAFTLKQPPLTFVSASTPSGVASTLEVRVNGARWHEAAGLAALGPQDRAYLTRTDDEGRTTLRFGNGQRGLRLPTGVENVASTYRNGLGRGGNVKAGQISLLTSKPLGVKAVVNPLRASGGADRETRDQTRGSTPLAVKALDRLVSLQDYADFARTFGGVAKASARRLSDGLRQVVHVTIAGAADIPIDATSDLFQNLGRAFAQWGDPHQPVAVGVREELVLVLSAKVRMHPDHAFDLVEPKIRAALLDAFGFERRDLAQPAYLSEAIQAVQSVEGVAFVDVDVFDAVSEDLSAAELAKLSTKFQGSNQPASRIPAKGAWVDPSQQDLDRRLRAAQLAVLRPELPDTLILKELP